MEFYDRSMDRLSVRMERPLPSTRRVFHSVSTTDDPKIRDLVRSSDATVFATDAILAAIMASPRSVYSWDLVIEKVCVCVCLPVCLSVSVSVSVSVLCVFFLCVCWVYCVNVGIL